MGEVTAFFPGAGSFGNEFRTLAGEGTRVVRYPGRVGRGFGVPAASFDDVVTACVAQVEGRPILFGHSFGAYVACATASRLEDAGTGVAALVVTGADAPARLRIPGRATTTPEDTAAYLNDVDPEVLADTPSDEWRDIVAETAMHDMRLLTGLDTTTPTELHCPVIAARGATDTLTSDDGIREWEHVTHGSFTTHVFPGGHSSFLGSTASVTWFRDALRDPAG
jgi:surfactin synthase thioesterase subunit